MHWATTANFAVCRNRDRKHSNSFVRWDSCAFEIQKRPDWIVGIGLRLVTKSKRAEPNRLRWVGIGRLAGLGWRAMRDEERWQTPGRLYIMGRTENCSKPREVYQSQGNHKGNELFGKIWEGAEQWRNQRWWCNIALVEEEDQVRTGFGSFLEMARKSRVTAGYRRKWHAQFFSLIISKWPIALDCMLPILGKKED